MLRENVTAILQKRINSWVLSCFLKFFKEAGLELRAKENLGCSGEP